MKKTELAAYVFGGSVGIAIACFVGGLIMYGLLALGVSAIAVYVHSQGEITMLPPEECEAIEKLIEQMRGKKLEVGDQLTAAESAAAAQMLERMRSKKG
jgi:hypothetical protein